MNCQRRKCNNKSDIFCYICGTYMVNKQKRNIAEKVKQMYLDYFQIMLGDQDKYWNLHKICQTCLTAWSKGLSNSMPFAIPMVWRTG